MDAFPSGHSYHSWLINGEGNNKITALHPSGDDPASTWLPSLVGGFNPFEKYESKWESSPNRGEHLKKLEPLLRVCDTFVLDASG